MKDCKVIQFKSKEQIKAERNFRHLSDHLDKNPCNGCIDKTTDYCENECPTMIRRAIIANVIKNGKSFYRDMDLVAVPWRDNPGDEPKTVSMKITNPYANLEVPYFAPLTRKERRKQERNRRKK